MEHYKWAAGYGSGGWVRQLLSSFYSGESDGPSHRNENYDNIYTCTPFLLLRRLDARSRWWLCSIYWTFWFGMRRGGFHLIPLLLVAKLFRLFPCWEGLVQIGPRLGRIRRGKVNPWGFTPLARQLLIYKSVGDGLNVLLPPQFWKICRLTRRLFQMNTLRDVLTCGCRELIFAWFITESDAHCTQNISNH